jgi:LysR family transcriptional activator of glutamate synthase operon
MEIRQLEMLMAVVERGGYLHAAEHLHVAHSAIHRQVRLLEEELGEKVFVKTGRSVHLTEAGRTLLDLAAKVSQEIAAVKQQVKDQQKLLSGNLRIGTGTTALMFFLPPILDKFRREFPGVQLYITTGTADQVIQGIRNRTLDLGLVNEPTNRSQTKKGLRYERLYTEQYQLAVSKRHYLAKRSAVRWSDLKGVPLISFPRDSQIRHLIDAQFEAVNIAPTVTMELENEEAIEEMIKTSLGVGFLAKRRIKSARLHGLNMGDKPTTLNVAAIYPDSYVPRPLREFLRICNNEIGIRTSRITTTR